MEGNNNPCLISLEKMQKPLPDPSRMMILGKQIPNSIQTQILLAMLAGYCLPANM
jgi:hypothetical protein